MRGRKVRFWVRLISILALLTVVLFNVRLASGIRHRNFVQNAIEQTNRTEVDPGKIVSDILSRMTPEQKIGQLVMVNYYGTDWPKIASLVTNYCVGGIMLKSENVDGMTFDQLRGNNRRLSRYSRFIPLFISVDQEGGDVARLDGLIREYPSPSELYRKSGEQGVIDQASYYSRKLKELGISINFSPVIDRITDPDSIVSGREYSRSVATNAVLANEYMAIFSGNGMIAVAKHYPGYGTVNEDPHVDVCRDDDSTLSNLAVPFDRLSGADMVMTAHIILSRVDPRPATLSSAALSYLRSRNTNLVVITDDIQMGAITEILDYRDAALEAINAGCDVALSVTKTEGDWYGKAVALVNYLRDAYRDGRLSASTLDAAVSRIVALKLRYLSDQDWQALDSGERERVGALYAARSEP